MASAGTPRLRYGCDRSLYFTSRLMPGADTLSSFAAPRIVPVTITARMTSTWRNVIL
jgi:hypothetical protein